MRAQLLVNVNLGRLPLALFGITFVDFNITGEVCPKLDITLTKASKSI